MKLDIENKILIPFVIIFFISVSVLLATSFRNDYKLIIENQFRSMDNKLEELERSINYRVENQRNEALRENEVLEEIEAIMIDNLILIKNDEPIYNSTSYGLNTDTLNLKNNFEGTVRVYEEDYLLIYKAYPPFNWKIIIYQDKKQLMAFFYESYKYNILTGIIFLTFALQMTILIALNITKPIQKLVKFCALVGNGESGERIIFKRKDEIGQLGLAFNQMLDQLDSSMNELIRVKNYNQDILNNIEKGIVTFDIDEMVISENPFAIQIMNELSNYTWEGRSLLSAISDSVTLSRGNKISNNGVLEFINAEDKDIRFIDFYTSIMWGETGAIHGYICSFNDITERKKIESRIQRLERLATAGRLASGVAHEIRNPLTGMRTSIQVLSKRLKNVLSGSNEVMFERLIKEIDRMNKLISDLLDYSKRSELQLEKVNVSHLVYDILALLENEFKSKDIMVEVDFEDSELTFYVDPSHFNQMVLNLIKNAIDALEVKNGRIRITGRYIDSNRQKGELNIFDNGTGIALDLIDKVFDPFFTTKSHGTGLGLSVVHELVQQNEGEIDIKSVENQGTTLALRFKTGGCESE